MSLSKPNLLFVDDRSKRLHYALDVHGLAYNVTLAPCVPEALRLLSAQEWTVVSLDHDLMGHDFEDPETPTCGMAIIRYIEKCGGWPGKLWPKKIPEFWIHSSNLFASHLMITKLLGMGIQGYYRPIKYPVQNMKYDEKGIPL